MRKAAKRLRESPVTPLTTRIPPTGKKRIVFFAVKLWSHI